MATKKRIGDIPPMNAGKGMTIYKRRSGGYWTRLTETDQKQMFRTESGDGWYGFGQLFDLNQNEEVEIVEVREP